MSLRDEILGANDLGRGPFPCPEWPGADGKLFAQEMTAADRVSLFLEWTKCKQGEQYEDPLEQARVAVRTLVDADGNRVFSDADAVKVGAKSAAVVRRAYKIGCELSGLGKEAAEAEAKK